MSELAIAVFAARSGSHVVREPRSDAFAAFRQGFDERAYRARLAAAGIRFVARSDRGFPLALRAIFDPPVGVFVRGEAELALLARPCVAVVGARSPSAYGRHVARAFGRELAAAGLVVVSGLARGIDGEAHRGALEAGGATVAVLGCGIDRDYPAGHAPLAARIAGSGLVLSEYAPGVAPAPWRFPARNRIVAGLSSVTVVVEARERSGALITADLAMEEGRDVMAVPGEITSALSAGTNGLLRMGAGVAASVQDVLGAFGLVRRGSVTAEVGVEARQVLVAIGEAPRTADELMRATGLAPAELGAALAELELGGLAAEGDGHWRALGGVTPAEVGGG